MNLTEAAYLIVHSDALEEWEHFATHHLGAMTSRDEAALYIRVDDLRYRLLVLPGGDGVTMGWAVRNRREFVAARQELIQVGIDVHDGTEPECAVRAVPAFISFCDPAGIRHEICWGRNAVAEPFVSAAGVRFVTGSMGFGHAVLGTGKNYEETIEFYEQRFGFEVSDFVRTPLPDGLLNINFMHAANSREHSLALANVPIAGGVNHVMVQVESFDDVGRMLDRALDADIVTASIGRHVNDGMVSFYLATPSGFQIEYGWGAEPMDWDNHDVRQYFPGTYWGHRGLF